MVLKLYFMKCLERKNSQYESGSHFHQCLTITKHHLPLKDIFESRLSKEHHMEKNVFFIGRCSHPEMFCKKKVFLKISQNSQENTCARVSFLIKLQFSFIKKEALAQVFSCEFSEISKDNFFHRIPLVAASVFAIKNYVNDIQKETCGVKH